MHPVLMARNTYIKNPIRYITPDLKEGEQVVVHLLSSKQDFVNLKFEENVGDLLYKPIKTVDDSFKLASRPNIQQKLSEIEDKIVALGGAYTAYSYLFTFKGNEVYLVSVTLTGLALGYEITKDIAEKLEVPTLPFIWKGKYNRLILNAFIEDVFLQRL